LDALARISVGHVYCHALRLSDRLARYGQRIAKRTGAHRR
jgi:hypothetical protein